MSNKPSDLTKLHSTDQGESLPVYTPAGYGTEAINGGGPVRYSPEETAQLTSHRNVEGGEAGSPVVDVQSDDLCSDGDSPSRLPVNHLNVSSRVVLEI